jgi:histidinol phosphatase-like enzyme (inositol monophosphatase family)
MSIEPEIVDFAQELARAARSETMHRWANGVAPTGKPSSSGFDPVTEADVEAERAMRVLIETRYPAHGITGEELPDRAAAGPYTWSLDPVDGTRSFICRLPTWVTLIGLLEHGQPKLGVVDAPCLDELYVGHGTDAVMIAGGARTRIRTSGCAAIAEARLSTTDPYLFAGAQAHAFEQLRGAARTIRFGHDGYAYARLAAGSIDLVVEAGLKPHDFNALIPLVTAAGGAIGNWRGQADCSDGQIVAAASQALFDHAVGVLQSAA